MSTLNLSIIGGGPFCTYALERLAAMLPTIELPAKLCISIFEKTSRFGSGATHSERQAKTSYMNRVASQIAFAADESNVDSSQLLPESLRPTFFEWTQAKYQATGDEQFNLLPLDVPLRYLHGEALKERFAYYVKLLRQIDNLTLDLYDEEVIDISRDDCSTAWRVHVGGDPGWSIPADHILLVTGHSTNHPAPGSLAATLALHARSMPPARYIPHAYPLHDHLCEESLPPGSLVAVLGLGLTAVDILLHLTEGRGGTFVPDANKATRSGLRYIAGGREPALIVAVSPSGMFTACRPNNEKALDGSGVGHAALEHKGIFLTLEAIRMLRLEVGIPVFLRDGVVRQLDFELHVFPLVVLEMAYVYYTTLFGTRFGDELCRAVTPSYRAFLREGCASRDAGIDHLLEPIQACFEDAAAYVRLRESGAAVPDELRRFEGTGVFETFLLTIYGQHDAGQVSPWRHSLNVTEHRFDWRTFFQPLDRSDGAEWQQRLIDYMWLDHLAAAQGNLRNPTKAACDGVWRDLRSVFSEVVDYGGLTARSHRRFMNIYWRFYSRMSNGTGLEPMNKVLALIEAGMVDVSVGPAPLVEPLPSRPLFRVSSSVTGIQREVEIIVEGRIHAFDPELDTGSLYPNMFRRGLVRRWRNPGGSCADDFYPGGLDLSKAFHPIQRDGVVNPRLTILGAPIEGVAFFQLSAARPQSNSSILNNVARWANEFVGAITCRDGRAFPVEHEAATHER